jgi:predicted O-methyltransferase YrrM
MISPPRNRVGLFRERIVRAGKCQWISPVHECLVAIDPTVALREIRLEDCEIVHAPFAEAPGMATKTNASSARNLRILESIPEASLTTSHRYHLFSELFGAGRMKESAAAGAAFIRLPEAGKTEKYEVLITLAAHSESPEYSRTLLHLAYGTDPSRREALVELANMACATGDIDDATAFHRASNALPFPKNAPWSTQRKFYGWLAIQIGTQIDRIKGEFTRADTIEFNHFQKHGAKISLLHATRGRPAQAAATRREWLNSAKNADAIEHIFALDAEDLDSQPLQIFRHVVVEKSNAGSVAAWNLAAAHSSGGILIQVSDDFHPPLHWDVAVRHRLPDSKKSAVLAVHDGHRVDSLLCIAILTRARYLATGYLFHPGFFSVFSDNHFTRAAYLDDVIVDGRDLTFRHDHPAFSTAPSDPTYERQNANQHYADGQRLYDLLAPLPAIPGFFDFRALYDHFIKILQPHDTFVEIGTFCGASIIHLARQAEIADLPLTIVAVDNFDSYEDGMELAYAVVHPDVLVHHSPLQAFRNFQEITKTDHLIRTLISDSAEAAKHFPDASVAIAFIDAGHDYVDVLRDITAWLPKIKPGGILAGHDIDGLGVSRAVADLLGNRISIVGRSWVHRKIIPTPLLESETVPTSTENADQKSA